MAEVLEGSSPGIPMGEIVAICCDTFGYRPDNTRFTGFVIRNANRAILDIWLDFPRIRRFAVIGAVATLQAGVSDYDVALPVDDGGFGWTNCIEITALRFADIQNPCLELIEMHQFRARQEFLLENGPPTMAVLIDQRRIKIAPTPSAASVGVGDYMVAQPYITDLADRVSWPQGWDQVVVLGAEYYLARTYRPELVNNMKRDYMEAREKLRVTEVDGGPPVKSAIVARNLRRARPGHYNDQDLRWRN